MDSEQTVSKSSEKVLSQDKESIDRFDESLIYGSINSCSVSSNEDQSLDLGNSGDLEEINKKTCNLQDLLSSRLTALAYFTKKLQCDNEKGVDPIKFAEFPIENSSQSIEKNNNLNKPQFDIKEIIGKMSKLQENYKEACKTLQATTETMKNLEEEEQHLYKKLRDIEFILKERARIRDINKQTSRNCDVF